MSSESPAASQIHLTEDEKILHKLGYAQELMRAMGAFRNFAISFTIISILAGCLTSYVFAYQDGGPVAVTWGWIIVGVATTFVALSMAEIASTYPTAGGLYYWSSKLGSAAWGWFTGWFNLIGLIGIIGAVGYGLATFATSLFNFWWAYPNDRHHIFYLFVGFLIAAALLNVWDVRITSMVNGFSAYWHVLGVGIIVGALIFVPNHHQSFVVRVREDAQQLGLLGARLEQRSLLDGVRDRLHRNGSVHPHGLRRIGAHVRGDAQRVPGRGDRAALLRRDIGRCRSHPARRRHVRDPEHDRSPRSRLERRDLHLADVDGHALGRVPAHDHRRRTVLLPHGVRDLGLADALRVLA